MCGIAGYVHKESCTNTCHEIELIIGQLQECRGPDAITSTNSKMGQYTVHLYHQRLRIQDLSENADQPMSSNIEAGTSIVFNGEIYNYRELRNQLINNGQTFVTVR